MRRLFRELKRRHVFRVAAVYAVVAWVVIQVANVVLPRLQLPGWTVTFVIVLVALGFPIVLVMAWAFEMTPEGVRRTADAEGAPEPESMSAEERRTRSRLAMKALVGLGLVGAAVAGGWYLLGGGRESPEVTEGTVAVVPFEVSGSGAEDWREAMVALLTPGLDGAAGLRAIPDRTVFAAAEQIGASSDEVSSEQALALARRVGARYAVVGSAVALGSDLRLNVTVHDTQSGRQLGDAQLRGSRDSMMALADSLTRRILGVLLQESGREIPNVDLASVTTQSVAALKSYVTGQRHHRAGRYDSAIVHFEAALNEDSTFALAQSGLAHARAWIGPGYVEEYRRAHELSDRLPARERRIVRAWYQALVLGKSVTAADTFRALTDRYPDDPRAWYGLGDVLMHGHVPGGLSEAERAFQRAIELDPGYARYHHHVVELGMTLHHDSAMTARRIADHPAGAAKRTYAVLHDLNFGSAEVRSEGWSRFDTLQPAEIPWIRDGLAHPTDRDLQEEVIRRLRARNADAEAHWAYLYGNLVAHGRIQGAVRVLPEDDRTCLLPTETKIQGIPVPDSVIARHVREAAVDSTSSTFPSRLLCAGFYHAAEGRSSEVSGLIPRLRRWARQADHPDEATAVVETWVDELEGFLAWKEGELERAARLWSNSKPLFWSVGALLRGDVYRELGQVGKAREWYRAAWMTSRAHHRLGQLYEQMDRPKKAAAAYRRFVAAWEDADPELQDRVEATRERLRKLNGSDTEADD